VVSAQVIETSFPKSVGKWLSGPALTMLIAMLMSSLGLLPSAAAPEFAFVWSWIMPVAAVLYMLQVDFRLLKKYGSQTLAAFLIGAGGTVLGTVCLMLLGTRLIGPGVWKVASSLCASCIGGSLNFAAVSQALQVPQAEMSAALASDNVVMSLYIVLLMVIRIPSPERSKGRDKASSVLRMEASGEEGGAGEMTRHPVTSRSLLNSLGAAAVVCYLGDTLATSLGLPSWTLAFVSLLSPLVGLLSIFLLKRLSPKEPGALLTQGSVFAGSSQLGNALMLYFFATIGGTASFVDMLKMGPAIFVLQLLLVSVHFLFTVVLGRACGIPLRILAVCSNANIGGPATAAAFASAKGWTELIQPSMLVGSLGYAVGTTVGLAVSQALRAL